MILQNENSQAENPRALAGPESSEDRLKKPPLTTRDESMRKSRNKERKPSSVFVIDWRDKFQDPAALTT